MQPDQYSVMQVKADDAEQAREVATSNLHARRNRGDLGGFTFEILDSSPM